MCNARVVQWQWERPRFGEITLRILNENTVLMLANWSRYIIKSQLSEWDEAWNQALSIVGIYYYKLLD